MATTQLRLFNDGQKRTAHFAFSLYASNLRRGIELQETDPDPTFTAANVAEWRERLRFCEFAMRQLEASGLGQLGDWGPGDGRGSFQEYSNP